MQTYTSPTSHKRTSVLIAERLAEMRERDPRLAKLLLDYITSLRMEAGRNRMRAQALEDQLVGGGHAELAKDR